MKKLTALLFSFTFATAAWGAAEIPAVPAAIQQAVRENNWKTFFDAYKQLTADAQRVKYLEHLFHNVLDPEKMGTYVGALVKIFDDVHTYKESEIIEHLWVPSTWRKILLQRQPSLSHTFDAMDAVRKRKIEEAVAQGMREEEEQCNKRRALTEKIAALPILAKQNVHPFEIHKEIYALLPTAQTHGQAYRENYWPRSICDYALGGRENLTSAVMLTALGYYLPCNDSNSRNANGLAAIYASAPDTLRLLQRLNNQLGDMNGEPKNMRLENIVEYNDKLEATTNALMAANLHIPKDLVPIIVGYAVPYRLGMPQKSMNPHTSTNFNTASGKPHIEWHWNCDGHLIDDINTKFTENRSGIASISWYEQLISRIPAGLFVSMPGLKRLNFSNNFIDEIDETAFEGAPNLEEIDLSTNCLTTWPKALDRIPQHARVNLENNPLDAYGHNCYTLFLISSDAARRALKK